MSDYNEDHYEQTLIELFTERLEYNYLNGYDIQNGFEDRTITARSISNACARN